MTDNNVINFPQIGFNLTPAIPSQNPAVPPLPTTPPTTPTTPATGPAAGRRSPLDTLAALPDPGILQPVITPDTTPGTVPATFRNDPPGDMIGPRLGALGLAATLAVAVAALRGTHTVLTTWWANRQARQAETAPLREARLKHQLAMQNIGDKAVQQRAKNTRVPSSNEFGRKSLGGRGSSTGAGRGGKSTGSGTGPTSKAVKTNGATPRKSADSRSTAGPGSAPKPPARPQKTPSNGGGTSRKNRSNDSPARRNGNGNGSGASDTAKRNRRKNDSRTPDGPRGNRTPSGRQETKAAERRQRRRNSRTNQPAGSTTPTTPNSPRTNRRRNGSDSAGGSGTRKNRRNRRTTLAGAIGHTAHRAAKKRLKRRRRTVTPPIWSAPRNRTQQPGPTAPTAPGTGAQQGTGGRRNGQQHGQSSGSRRRDWWTRARAYARRNATNGDCFTTQAPTTGPTPQAGATPGGTQESAAPGPAAGSTTNQGGGSGPRRSPFENAGQAAAEAEGVTYTVVSEHVPGSQARTWQPAAITTGQATLPPSPAGRPVKENRPMNTHQGLASSHSMADEHATEITLDDSLDEAAGFAEDAFKTHDECHRLAEKAHTLHTACIDLANELATKHNLIGRLFQGALARFAESMDLVDRMAQEMRMSSLEAAEMAEALSNDLDDAYRPYTQATADAGLTTPSAPIHNQT